MTEIKEHMKVIGADGTHVDTVDKVEGNRIKLTRRLDACLLECRISLYRSLIPSLACAKST
jgi:hypothetical protein